MSRWQCERNKTDAFISAFDSMALCTRAFFSIMLLFRIIFAFQINLYRTKGIAFRYHCLRAVADADQDINFYQVLTFCLTTAPTTGKLKESDKDQRFSFDELYQQNITSEQLYRWSAPIDTVESYQLYINQRQIQPSSSWIETAWFYNCTSSRFGPTCQYSFEDMRADYSTIEEFLLDFYRHEYQPSNLTCYTHLTCMRGASLACLDWTEICDGYVDCLNEQIDEKDCFQMELQRCREDEYQCENGQCISKVFYRDGDQTFECLDQSDEGKQLRVFRTRLGEPTFANEDIVCSDRLYRSEVKATSSCVYRRQYLLEDLMLIDTPKHLSDICWLAFQCRHTFKSNRDPLCLQHCGNDRCTGLFFRECPDPIILPATALAFGHIFVAYCKKVDIYHYRPLPDYICYNEQLCSSFHTDNIPILTNGSVCRLVQDFSFDFQSSHRP